MSVKKAAEQIVRDLENPEGDSIYIVFYERARFDETESKEKGRPIYKNTVFIRKHISKNSVYDGPAREDDFRAYPQQYNAFQLQRRQRAEGIPIGMLPAISPAEVERCEICKIYTIEQLQNADEQTLLDIGNPELGKRARQYLSGESEKDDLIKQLQEKIERLENDNTINSAKRGGRNAAVRKTTDTSK